MSVENGGKRIYNDGYVKGHNDGWRGAVKAYSFGKPDNEVVDKLDKKYKEGYKDGHNDCSEELHSHMSEKELEYKKQGFEDGYNTAIKEMSNNQALGEDIGEESESISILDFGAIGEGYTRELYSVTEGVDIIDFIKKNFDNIKSFAQVGDVASIEMFDKYNSGRNEQLEKELALVEKYPHYYKDIRHLNIIDIYRFLDLFGVSDPCIQHAAKKLSVGGKRGTKDYEKDVKEAMDTLNRWEYMQEENKRGLND